MTGGSDTAEASTDQLERLIALARLARRIVVFTGAGISTESGIPDYRGPDGVWARQALPTLAGFVDDLETRRDYWERRRTGYPTLAATMPNQGHLALAALERAGRLAAVITQNIDGLHQKAGNDPERVIELHGNAHVIQCMNCARRWPAAEIQARLYAGEILPSCTKCGGMLRATTILFGEALPVDALRRAAEMAQSADLLLVVGSSLVVNPAAQLPLLAKRSGAALAIMNHTPTPLDGEADVLLRSGAGATLTAIVGALDA